MKKVVVVLIFVVLAGFLALRNEFFLPTSNQIIKKPIQNTPTIIPTNTPQPAKPVNSIFIPYWTVGKAKIDTTNYDELIYFGIQATTDGIDTTENGYLNIPKFIKDSDSSKQRLLTIRMIDTQTNNKILDDKSSQRKIISESIAAAQKYKFDGLVLDFEISAISFDSVVKGISSFEQAFDQQATTNNLTFSILIYGDNFYRARPFDVKKIGEHADKIYIMAYDFSKAGGTDPGPNFPLYGANFYGYDFTQMISDFQKQAPTNKLSIVYGMYGYNWMVDNNNKSQGLAQSLTDNQITQLFYPTCNQSACVVKNDEQSGETKITYQDHDGQKHTVWFEDTNSATKKQNYAKSKGITNAAYWAYSYF